MLLFCVPETVLYGLGKPTVNGETVQLPGHSHWRRGMTAAGGMQVCGPKLASRSVPNASEQEQAASAAEKSREISHKLLKTFESNKIYLPCPNSQDTFCLWGRLIHPETWDSVVQTAGPMKNTHLW